MALEDILQRFEAHKDLFKHPAGLSAHHEDVTAKYAIAMIASAQERGVDLLSSFATRFSSDRFELQSVVSRKNNWMDYLLYVAFALHAQQELGMTDEEFHHAIAGRVFADYSDDAIKLVSMLFPLSTIMGGMNRQFPNWARVTDVNVDSAKPGALSFRITRKTKDGERKRLAAVVGDDLLPAVLARDCAYTVASFETTFQKVYRQDDLRVKTVLSEGDGAECSVYEVFPSAPYRTQAGIFLSRTGRFLRKWFLPWWEVRVLEKRNGIFEEEAFTREQVIRAMTTDLREANAQLEERQETIVDMLTEIARLNASGSRHQIRNRYQTAAINLRNDITQHVAAQLVTAYTFVSRSDLLSEETKRAKQYLLALCEPFGISENTLRRGTHTITHLLEGIDLIGSPPKEDDIFASSISGDAVYFKTAYPVARDIAAGSDSHFLHGFNPFSTFNYWITLAEVIGDVNETLASGDALSFLDRVQFSEALQLAGEHAQRDKGRNITLETEIRYDPVFSTHKPTFVMMLRDIVYNAIDAGAAVIHVETQNPLALTRTPEGFDEHPAFFALFDGRIEPVREGVYVLLEDDGRGIPSEQATLMNDYLRGTRSEKKLSTKSAEGGLGTRNLKKLLDLHQGRCVYQPYVTEDHKHGTRIHLYFGRLAI